MDKGRLPAHFSTELREALKKRRALLNEHEQKEKSGAICDKLVQHHFYDRAKTILFYLATAGEVDATPAIRHALRLHKKVVLPVVDRERHALLLRQVTTLETQLQQGYAGIKEPKEECPPVLPETIDLAFIPGMAFDERGNRLGFGKGFYDRLLPQIKALKVGIAYEFQIVGSLPAKPSDVPMDYLITEQRIITCTKK